MSGLRADKYGIKRNFELPCRRIVGSDEYRIHLVGEKITLPGTPLVSPPVLATNIYQQMQDGWYMVLHHASVSPAPLPPEEEAPSDEDERPPMLH